MQETFGWFWKGGIVSMGRIGRIDLVCAEIEGSRRGSGEGRGMIKSEVVPLQLTKRGGGCAID